MLLELYFENGKSRLPAVLLALVQIFFKHMTDKLSFFLSDNIDF